MIKNFTSFGWEGLQNQQYTKEKSKERKKENKGKIDTSSPQTTLQASPPVSNVKFLYMWSFDTVLLHMKSCDLVTKAKRIGKLLALLKVSVGKYVP